MLAIARSSTSFFAALSSALLFDRGTMDGCLVADFGAAETVEVVEMAEEVRERAGRDWGTDAERGSRSGTMPPWRRMDDLFRRGAMVGGRTVTERLSRRLCPDTGVRRSQA